jgi:hypothetical protein
MDSDAGLSVHPDALLGEFVTCLATDEERTFVQLAKSVGSKDISKPRRAIGKFLDATEIFGLARTSATGVVLTSRGLRFRGGPQISATAVRGAFYSAPIPSAVLKALSATATLSRADARKRLATLGREAELDVWLEWLKYGRCASVEGETIAFDHATRRVYDLYFPEELGLLEEERYRHLAATGYSNPASESEYSYHAIKRALDEFRKVPPEKAEGVMRKFVQGALTVMGIIAQTEDGPREAATGPKKSRVHFGSQGEDSVGFFLRPPAVLAETSAGLVLAMELKRTASDKKAVGQATTAAGQWRAYFDGKATVLALTISDSETYAEKAAREYAATNGVVHLPAEALAKLAALQQDLFTDGRNLIVPVHIWALLDGFVQTGYTEPTTSDVIQGTQELLESD